MEQITISIVILYIVVGFFVIWGLAWVFVALSQIIMSEFNGWMSKKLTEVERKQKKKRRKKNAQKIKKAKKIREGKGNKENCRNR